MANTGRVTQSVLIAGTLQNGTARLTQSVIIAAIGVGINCGNPPVGAAGLGYSHIFPAGGGNPPYTFSITSGSLPPGLSLDPATGIVSGSTSVGGTFPFTITVTDSMLGTASVNCSITIAPLNSPILAGTRRKTCPPGKKTDLDWSVFSQAMEQARPPDVEEVRVPLPGGMLRTN